MVSDGIIDRRNIILLARYENWISLGLEVVWSVTVEISALGISLNQILLLLLTGLGSSLTIQLLEIAIPRSVLFFCDQKSGQMA